MKRIFLIGAIFLSAAPAAAALAVSGAPRAALAVSTAPRAHLDSFVCHTAPALADRSVSIRAVMRPVLDTRKMEMRFELLSRSGARTPFVDVPGGGLGSWISPSDPTLGRNAADVWLIPDVVRNLPAPAVYRYRVSFRWRGKHGRVLALRTLTSSDCREPAFQPDLLVSSITVQPIAGKPQKDQYVVTILNDGVGPTPAGVAVAFAPGAATTPGVTPTTTTKLLPPLDVGATNVVSFVGPACTAATAPTVVVDPGHTVAEASFTNNSLTVDPSCPPTTSGPPTTP
ncbi:MAG TPA: CARDB domain-containing protein [Solirubrobacteraceae bacterium]|jgi:hypothetical protein|nr:CARDB domain-containing protein [Solirubrobacteraceae bacterium]